MQISYFDIKSSSVFIVKKKKIELNAFNSRPLPLEIDRNDMGETRKTPHFAAESWN